MDLRGHYERRRYSSVGILAVTASDVSNTSDYSKSDEILDSVLRELPTLAVPWHFKAKCIGLAGY